MYTTKKSLRVGIYEKALPDTLSWKEKFSEVVSLGFDFFEISIDETEERLSRLDWSNSKIYELRHLCEECNLPLQSMCLSALRKYSFGSADKATREKAKQTMDKAITLAYKLGIRVIQLAGYDVYYEPSNEETHQRFIEGMQWSAKQAERAGVMLGVEIMETPYLNSLSKFELLKREIPSPFFMVYPDMGNVSGWNNNTHIELNLSRDHLVQIHLKETYKVKPGYAGQFRDLVLGEGEVDFASIFKTLKGINYTAPIVIEMWAQNDQWRENIILAQKCLQEASSQSGIELFPHLS